MAQGEEGSRRNMSIFQGFETWHWVILAKSLRDAIPAPQVCYLWVLTLRASPHWPALAMLETGPS